MKMVFISTMIFVKFLLRNLEKINHIFRRHECLCKNDFSTVALMRFIVGPIPFGAGEEAGSWPACPLWDFWWKRWIVLWKARFCERSWVLLFITVIFHYVWWFMIGIWDICKLCWRLVNNMGLTFPVILRRDAELAHFDSQCCCTFKSKARCLACVTYTIWVIMGHIAIMEDIDSLVTSDAFAL